MRGLWLALGLATRLPIPDPGPVAAAELATAVTWLPVVGALLGAILVGVDSFAERVLPGPTACAGVVLVWVALTGGTPLVSVVRVCQAVADRRLRWRVRAGRREGERTWIGGAIGLGTLLMKFGLLAVLPAAHRWEVLLLAPIWGRQAGAAALLLAPFGAATPERLRGLREATSKRQLWMAALPLVLSGLVWRAWTAPVVIVLAPGLWWTLRRLAQILEGLTADTAEAVAEWTELLVLMCLVALLAGQPEGV